MHTTGRKTGQSRTVPISYFSDGDNFFVVGSNWGEPQNAGWYFNLKNNPHALLEISGKKISVVAHEADGDEYMRLWQIAVEKNPPYEEYKKNAGRHLPIMVFVPVS
jgi:deazaflavin-dependent oxidoreductase (nitroreductase family)